MGRLMGLARCVCRERLWASRLFLLLVIISTTVVYLHSFASMTAQHSEVEQFVLPMAIKYRHNS